MLRIAVLEITRVEAKQLDSFQAWEGPRISPRLFFFERSGKVVVGLSGVSAFVG
jgi:hypothetical protein